MSVRKKPLVVVTRKLPDSIETRMRELFDARLNLDDVPLTPEQIAEAVRTADILVPTVTDEITEDVLKQPDLRLRMIANFGNGVDNIDVTAAHARGITVTNTPKVLTEDTADMTMALILAVPRRLKLIRKDAYIVNTARGGVTDEDTLIKLIEGGEIGGAGLDVYEHEPVVNPKLVRLGKAGKVTLLPHMGSATIEGRVDMGEKVIINIKTWLDGHRPPDRVLPQML